jgi:hypothetical protein
MKSDVKKKMTLGEHTTPTPKSPKLLQEEKFRSRNVLLISRSRSFLAKRNKIVFASSSHQTSGLKIQDQAQAAPRCN